jgi:hypothetical protein
METAEQLCQRILDEQGYYVTCVHPDGPDFKPGSVLKRIELPTKEEPVDCPVVVTDTATADELERQARRYYPQCILDPRFAGFDAPGWKYYKVKAE